MGMGMVLPAGVRGKPPRRTISYIRFTTIAMPWPTPMHVVVSA
jgi:hypothetical protein